MSLSHSVTTAKQPHKHHMPTYVIFGDTVSIYCWVGLTYPQIPWHLWWYRFYLLLGGTHVSPDSMTSLVLPFLFTVGWDSRIPRFYDIFGATVSIYCWVGLTYPQIIWHLWCYRFYLLLGGTHVSPDSMTSLVIPFLFTVGWDSRIPRLYDIFGATVFLFTVGWDSRIPRFYVIFGDTVSIYCWVGLTYPQILWHLWWYRFYLLLGGTHVSPDYMTSLVLPFLFTVGWDSRIPRFYVIFGDTVSIYCWVGLTYTQIIWHLWWYRFYLLLGGTHVCPDSMTSLVIPFLFTVGWDSPHHWQIERDVPLKKNFFHVIRK